MISALRTYVFFLTLVNEALPSESESTYLAAVSAPFSVNDTVAKGTGSDVFESTSLSFTVTCANADTLTKSAMTREIIFVECFIAKFRHCLKPKV